MTKILKTFLLCSLFFTHPSWANDVNRPLFIAHAGGGYQNKTYTNSIEALESNKNKYDIFEIDFNFTGDGKLVCVHDWDEYFAAVFGVRLINKPTESDFINYAQNNPMYTNCTFDSLVLWLKENPGKKVVTDIKDNNLNALIFIKNNYPDFKRRIIPQIYNPDEYNSVNDLGYENIILTLYRWAATDDEVVNELQKRNNYYAVTMWHHRAKILAPRLKKMGIAVYAHTVNDPNDLSRLLNEGVSGVYTDWLVGGY